MLSSRQPVFDRNNCVMVGNLVIEMPGKGTELRANSDLTRVGMAALRPKTWQPSSRRRTPWKSDAPFEDDEDDMIHLFLTITLILPLITPLNTLR